MMKKKVIVQSLDGNNPLWPIVRAQSLDCFLKISGGGNLLRPIFWLQILLVVVFLFFSTFSYAAEVKVTNAEITSEDNITRLIFSLNGFNHYHVFTLSHPGRLVIDINQCQLTTNLHHLRLPISPLQDVRSAEHQHLLRIVFDLKEPVTVSSFFVPAWTRAESRLVIDLQSHSSSKSLPTRKETPEVVSKVPLVRVSAHAERDIEKRQSLVSSAENLNQRHRHIMVVIDPGHGGKDPGATGPSGIHEKDVVLAIAKDLRDRLNQIKGIQAVLTRNRDYFIPLRGRLQIARQNKADLFIAIHADAYRKTNSEGASVFALSERGASNEAARWLAERENYSELGGVQNFSEKSRLVRSVLLDLSQTVTIAQSLQMGKALLNSLQQLTTLHYDVVEQARFVVLKSPDIPSLLVETGFITNPLEERRLNSPNYQNRLAKALTIGIEKYFARNPLPG